LTARLASATPGQGVTVLFLQEPKALLALAARLRGPAKGREMPSPQEKMQLAMSGDREQRFQLLRDPNKQLHQPPQL
jgi:hypothetical protein